MKIRKDSLLVKIVFYNDIAIFITSVLVAMVVIITSFQGLEKKLEDTAKYKIDLLITSYNAYFSEIRNDIYKDIGKEKINEGNQEIAEKIKENLLESDFKNYYDNVVTILSEKGELLGEVGNKDDLGTLTEKNIGVLIENCKKKDLEENGYYLVSIKNKIYARVIVPYSGSNNEMYYIVVSIPINEAFFVNLRESLDLRSKDKIIFLDNASKNIKKIKSFFGTKIYNEIKKEKYKNCYFNKNIDGLPYYIGSYNLIDYKSEYLGSFTIALSKEKMIEEKMMLTVYIGILVLLIMILSSTISSRLLKNLLLPLSQMADIADDITEGKKVEEIDVIGQGEIRTLSISFKQMLEKINIAQQDLKIQNKELMDNISRIEAIDRLLISLNLEKETESTIRELVKGFTSDEGLKYSRAMYFRYSRENDYFIGEQVAINSFYRDRFSNGFAFQIKELEELIKFTKIPNNGDNLIFKSFNRKKIIYKNDNGYKYDLGNDLLKAIGLKNFFIFPIHDAGRFSGVILVDNYTKDIKINKEELELLNLLAVNVSVGINNKELVTTTLENNRVETIEKLANRFLRLRGEVVEKLLKCVSTENNMKTIIDELSKVRPCLERIKEDNNSLKSYSTKKNMEFEKINLDCLINESLEKYKKKFNKKNISVSFFNATSGIILGDKFYLENMLDELFENSIQALEERKTDRRLDIILTKRKINEKIELKIIDNGIGMNQEQIEDIYEPFISYFPNRLGLGLFFVHKIIKEHQGVVKHFSEYGKNTEVKITLNAYKEEI